MLQKRFLHRQSVSLRADFRKSSSASPSLSAGDGAKTINFATFVACMKASLKKIYASLGADGLVVLWLGVWWVCNLLQAGFSELANDEAYYHMFAENLAWGYFDHPPMTALLVWLGEHLFGANWACGFSSRCCKPLYLYILWRIIRPRMPTGAMRRSSSSSASTLMLQLYGFIAVPDGPLMMTTALFLLTFKRFSENRRWAWLWMGVAMALMAYSKYHGALVVLFTLAVTPPCVPASDLYLSGAVALLLLVPHFMWQAGHDWASFAYHLAGRNSVFRLNYVAEYLLQPAGDFQSLLRAAVREGLDRREAAERRRTCAEVYPRGVHRLFSCSRHSRGYVQPQWVIVAVFGLIYTLFTYARRHPRIRRYLMCAGLATILLAGLVRLEMIFNPLGLRFEVFDNPASYGRIAGIAGGRPVIFRHGYAVAAKYAFYTGRRPTASPISVTVRTSGSSAMTIRASQDTRCWSKRLTTGRIPRAASGRRVA